MNLYSDKWLRRFLNMAWEVAGWSKDPSTGVGCAIVNQSGAIVATGYNGLPRGVEDKPERMERPAKYLWTTHAEENAVANAARTGACLFNTIAVVTHAPCSRCAGVLINAGVAAVVIGSGQTNMPAEEFEIGNMKLKEAKVMVIRKDKL